VTRRAAALAALGAALLCALAGPAAAKHRHAARSTAPAAAVPSTTPPPPADLGPHAPAGAADCIWSDVPQDIRDAVTVARSIDVVADAIKRLGSSAEDRTALAHQCGVPDSAAKPADLVLDVVEARTMEIWTAGQLQAAYAIGPDRLAGAWLKVAAADRSQFAQWFLEGFDAHAAQVDRMQGMMDDLGLSGEDAASLVAYYAGARALYEQLGGTG
jgi:hypothetical protein